MGYQNDALSSCGLGYRKDHDALCFCGLGLASSIPISSATDTGSLTIPAGRRNLRCSRHLEAIIMLAPPRGHHAAQHRLQVSAHAPPHTRPPHTRPTPLSYLPLPLVPARFIPGPPPPLVPARLSPSSRPASAPRPMLARRLVRALQGLICKLPRESLPPPVHSLPPSLHPPGHGDGGIQ